MILYLDTSAFVPLLVEEASSRTCAELWNAADGIATVRLTYVESVAAIAAAARRGRISSAKVQPLRQAMNVLFEQINTIDDDENVLHRAADLAAHHGLRGYDSVHCAAALRINQTDLVAATGDKALLRAWKAEGVATSDTHAQPSSHEG